MDDDRPQHDRLTQRRIALIVHIVNPLWNANGGSEWHAVSLFELLAETHDVTLWTEETPDPAFIGRYPVRRIGPGCYPQGGTIVFLGVYFRVGPWLKFAKPKRLIAVYNFRQPDRLTEFLAGMRAVPGLPDIEVSFVSDYLRRLTPGLPGVVNHSPLDLTRFQPGPSVERPFTIGKVSRSDLEKHHPDDLALYEKLAARGVKVRLLGGDVLEPDPARRASMANRGIDLLPAGSEPVERFLHSLDLFYYRNNPICKEAWGRVIFEAMATGLPVVAGREGGYADMIRHGDNGYLFDTTGEAQKFLDTLEADPNLRHSIGEAGRKTALEIYSPEALSKLVEFYAG